MLPPPRELPEPAAAASDLCWSNSSEVRRVEAALRSVARGNLSRYVVMALYSHGLIELWPYIVMALYIYMALSRVIDFLTHGTGALHVEPANATLDVKLPGNATAITI